MLKKGLQALIVRYNKATGKYEKPNERVRNLVVQRDQDLHDELLTKTQRLNVLDNYNDEIYEDALPSRNFYVNIASKLYFVIAKK